MGSSVPLWPSLRVPSTRRSFATTSKLVQPAGLSATRIPCISAAGPSSTAAVSARTAALTLSSAPCNSQPAARRWPPPPSRRAMAQASTPCAVRMLTRQLPPGCWRKVSPARTPSMPAGRLVNSSRSAGSAPLAAISSRVSQSRAQRPSRWYSRWLRATRSASIWPRLLVAKRMVFSSSTRAPASISRAAARWVCAVVLAKRKQPVSVARPVYRQAAICGVSRTPIASITSHSSSAAAAASGSTRLYCA